ncbi:MULTISPECIES: class I SAM-dependent methyltransferase [Niastella]|uniref:Methyltransferase domain-containing protein n=1 Tax=Niastella soli TaxID=2821487 RepID=A0ABS3YSM6_9BACT|nr:class I SAM-dependent methyltransferase [Niastella soli]MBO9200868.1 methyltransferase domain-containing protein [Niastella soli]
MAITENNTWNTSLYNKKHDFVFKYGEYLVQMLTPQEGERILDVGCGTGYLTNLIAASGALVTGMDNSIDMIAKARNEYPHLPFRLASVTDFDFNEPYDALFSNAVLHWVIEKEQAVKSMYNNLKPGGRLVLEMGGKGNVETIIQALKKALINHGYKQQASRELWYFPSLSEYTGLLEKQGFRVTYAAHYNRETELKDTQQGIKDWVNMFGGTFLEGIEPAAKDNILEEVQEALRKTQFRNQKWYADNKRLRVVAIKEN